MCAKLFIGLIKNTCVQPVHILFIQTRSIAVRILEPFRNAFRKVNLILVILRSPAGQQAGKKSRLIHSLHLPALISLKDQLYGFRLRKKGLK